MSAAVDVQHHPDHRPPFPPPPMHPALPLLGHQPGPLQRQLHPTVAEQQAVLLPKLFVKMPHTEIKILLPIQGQHALHYCKRYPPRRRLPGAPVVETVVAIGPVPVIQPPQLPRTQPQYLGRRKPMNLLADGPQNRFLYFHRPLQGDPGVNHSGNLPECGLHPAASQKRTFHMLIKRTYHVLTTERSEEVEAQPVSRGRWRHCGAIRICPTACTARGRGCRGGGFARSDGAFAGGGRLPEFSRLPIDAGPAALFHSFPVGGRRRIPEARGIAAYRAIPRTHGCAPRSAARCDQDRDDRMKRRWRTAIQSRALSNSIKAGAVPSIQLLQKVGVSSGTGNNCESHSLCLARLRDSRMTGDHCSGESPRHICCYTKYCCARLQHYGNPRRRTKSKLNRRNPARRCNGEGVRLICASVGPSRGTGDHEWFSYLKRILSARSLGWISRVSGLD